MASDTYRIVEGQYLRDILDQPRAVAVTREKLKVPAELESVADRVQSGQFKRLVLTGMGASLHALYPLYLQLTARGLPTICAETSELIHYLPRLIAPETLLIAVSQSGESAEIVRLLEVNHGRAAVVGISNSANSTLAMRSNASLLTHAGQEFSVSCKTYVTALMALHVLGAILSGGDCNEALSELEQLAPAVDSYLHGWKSRVLKMAADLEGVRELLLLGRGGSLAAANAGALILKESVRFQAEGMSGAAFRHGPLEMVTGETFAMVFAGAQTTRALQENLIRDIRHAGGRAVWIEEDPGPGAWNLPLLPDSLRPILEILPPQMATLALGAQKGMEAGRFAIATKVTTTE